MSIKVLCIGEVVGKAGIFCLKKLLPEIKKEENIDFVIANTEGVTGGFGIGKNHSIYMRKLGIDCQTLGEKGFYKKDLVEHIVKAPYILRPANYPPGAPGRGWRLYDCGDKKIGVISMLGQSGFSRTHLSNPFTYAPDLVSKLNVDADIIIMDFHAATTAEKYTMFHLLDGKASAVIGTHTKALTADEQIFPKGTAIIGDTGRCGSIESVGGLAPKIEIEKFLTQIPERSSDTMKRPELQGAIIEFSDDGKATSIKRIRKECSEAVDDRDSSSN
ncbi:MAG: TIGR00282 family metallophosphoesterase [Spirochaetales bacterium]|nr:TIGR00282 family metallophosphoesterase [Spirochaetales bacterium]